MKHAATDDALIKCLNEWLKTRGYEKFQCANCKNFGVSRIKLRQGCVKDRYLYNRYLRPDTQEKCSLYISGKPYIFDDFETETTPRNARY